MTIGLIGAAAGLALAAVEFVCFRLLAARVELPETRRVLNVAGLIQFVLFPVVGWFVARALFGD